MTRYCPVIRGRTALVLDSDASTRERLARAMSKSGLLVLEAATEEEAVMLGKCCLDLQFLVADLSSQTMEGRLLLDFLRAIHSDLRFLVLSAQDCEASLSSRLGTRHVAWLAPSCSDAEVSEAVTRLAA